MASLNLPRSRSSTGSSSGFHHLPKPTLLRPSDAESSKHHQHAGRRLSKMRDMISSSLTKTNSHCPSHNSNNYTQTLPTSRPKVRRTISRSMIAPLQHLFGLEQLEEAEGYESQPWSLTLSKASTTIFSRRGPAAVVYQPTLSDDDQQWDFRCQGMAPLIPPRPSEEDALSPTTPAAVYTHSLLLASPGYFPHPASSSSASSCCSSPGPCPLPLRSLSADTPVKKQKISVHSISGPINLASPRSLSLLPPPPAHRKRNQIGLAVKP